MLLNFINFFNNYLLILKKNFMITLKFRAISTQRKQKFLVFMGKYLDYD